MKKLFALLLSLSLALSLAACGSSSSTRQPAQGSAGSEAASSVPAEETTEAGEESASPEELEESTAPEESEESAAPAPAEAEEVELTVFAAASMTETLNAIAEQYKEIAPNVTLVFNFDSSGTLKTQIQEGAECDLFLSAGQKQMNQLDSADTTGDNEGGLDLVASDTRIDLLENKVTLCVSSNAPGNLTSFDALARSLRGGDVLMAMGNSDVPVGQYTQKILAYYDLDEESLAQAGCITYGSNVKEVTTQVSEGSVDCGVIYCTDAYSAGLEVADYATAEMCGQVIYPAAVLKNAAHPTQAQAFLDYLTTPEAMSVFEEVGFSAVG